MNTTERNLLIAETMGLKYYIPGIGNTHYNELLYNTGDGWKVWHPDQSAEQREMIKDWLRKNSIGYSGGYNSLEKYHWFTIYTRLGANIDTRDGNTDAEAFLQAVAEYCETLKKSE